MDVIYLIICDSAWLRYIQFIAGIITSCLLFANSFDNGPREPGDTSKLQYNVSNLQGIIDESDVWPVSCSCVGSQSSDKKVCKIPREIDHLVPKDIQGGNDSPLESARNNIDCMELCTKSPDCLSFVVVTSKIKSSFRKRIGCKFFIVSSVYPPENHQNFVFDYVCGDQAYDKDDQIVLSYYEKPRCSSSGVPKRISCGKYGKCVDKKEVCQCQVGYTRADCSKKVECPPPIVINGDIYDSNPKGLGLRNVLHYRDVLYLKCGNFHETDDGFGQVEAVCTERGAYNLSSGGIGYFATNVEVIHCELNLVSIMLLSLGILAVVIIMLFGILCSYMRWRKTPIGVLRSTPTPRPTSTLPPGLDSWKIVNTPDGKSVLMPVNSTITGATGDSAVIIMKRPDTGYSQASQRPKEEIMHDTPIPVILTQSIRSYTKSSTGMSSGGKKKKIKKPMAGVSEDADEMYFLTTPDTTMGKEEKIRRVSIQQDAMKNSNAFSHSEDILMHPNMRPRSFSSSDENSHEETVSDPPLNNSSKIVERNRILSGEIQVEPVIASFHHSTEGEKPIKENSTGHTYSLFQSPRGSGSRKSSSKPGSQDASKPTSRHGSGGSVASLSMQQRLKIRRQTLRLESLIDSFK